MFKSKLFLYGFGTGLIVASLLLQLMSYSEKATPTDTESMIEHQISSFIILPDMDTDEVASQLLQLNLIENKEEWTQAWNEMHLNAQIKPGTYRFEGRPNIDQILERITAS